ncbi:MAG: hypothetical protein WBA10_14495 [Elainellaceae cyanobacterium]
MKRLRKLHSKAAPLVFIPLLLTALTGIGYRLGRSWLGISDTLAGRLMSLHEGRFLGSALVPIYVLLVGLGLVGMVATGITMIRLNRASLAAPAKRKGRWIHQILAPITLLPLLLTALTGMAYRLGRAWFGLSGDQASLLMRLHQGSYLGNTLKPLYVLFVGAGLIALLWTGIQMTAIFRERRASRASQSPE